MEIVTIDFENIEFFKPLIPENFLKKIFFPLNFAIGAVVDYEDKKAAVGILVFSISQPPFLDVNLGLQNNTIGADTNVNYMKNKKEFKKAIKSKNLITSYQAYMDYFYAQCIAEIKPGYKVYLDAGLAARTHYIELGTKRELEEKLELYKNHVETLCIYAQELQKKLHSIRANVPPDIKNKEDYVNALVRHAKAFFKYYTCKNYILVVSAKDKIAKDYFQSVKLSSEFNELDKISSPETDFSNNETVKAAIESFYAETENITASYHKMK